jgi:hypothetical protein
MPYGQLNQTAGFDFWWSNAEQCIERAPGSKTFAILPSPTIKLSDVSDSRFLKSCFA